MTKSLSININNNLEERVARSLWTLFLLALGIYAFMIGSITISAISSKSMEANARALTSEVNKLELSYLRASESIDINYAYQHNFTEAKTQSFASLDSVALNGEAR